MTEIMPFPKTIYCFIGPPLRVRPFLHRRGSVSLCRILGKNTTYCVWKIITKKPPMGDAKYMVKVLISTIDF